MEAGFRAEPAFRLSGGGDEGTFHGTSPAPAVQVGCRGRPLVKRLKKSPVERHEVRLRGQHGMVHAPVSRILHDHDS